MIISARDGIRGILLDLDEDRPIPKVIWADTELGLFCAYQTDKGGNILKDDRGNYLWYKAKARLRFIPTANLSVPSNDPPALAPPLKRRDRSQARRIVIPLFDQKCSECSRVAEWSVSDEISLPPVKANGQWFSRGKTVDVRFYCSWCYKPPRLVDSKGEIIKEFEEAGGVRPQWHS